MAVIDLTDDPRIDIEMAKSIGKLLKSVGDMERNRQNRHQMDQIMSDINSGTDPDEAIMRGRRSRAPRDKGLAGVWQGAGQIMGGGSGNVTNAMIENALMGKLRGERNRQLQLKATEGGFANYDSHAGTLTPVGGDIKPPNKVNPDKAVPYLQDQLNRFQEAGSLTPVVLRRLGNQANALGVDLVEKDTQNYAGTKTAADGSKYRDYGNGPMTILPRMKYVLEDRPEAKVALEAPTTTTKAQAPATEVPPAQAPAINQAASLGEKWMAPEITKGTLRQQIDAIKAGPGTPKQKRALMREVAKRQPDKGDQTELKAASATPPSGEVTLQDENGRVVGTMPDLPDRTYVEVGGKTFTIPNDQLNDFREAYPKASVYQIDK